MKKTLETKVVLSNGEKMPIFGLGVYDAQGATKQSVLDALEAGYRLIDTAAFYGNEREVGEAIRESRVAREDIFVTTKVWNDKQREGKQRESFERSLELLGLDYLDLYLVHWPIPEKIGETWKVLEQINEEGLAKSIGVSNFLEHHLEKLSVHANIAPTVDQFECNPYLTRKSLREYCREHHIVSEAWSPLGRGAALTDPVILDIANKYNKSAAQIILRFDVQNDIVTIPKSVKKERIIENSNVFDFELDVEELEQIEQLNRNEMHGDPDKVDF